MKLCESIISLPVLLHVSQTHYIQKQTLKENGVGSLQGREDYRPNSNLAIIVSERLGGFKNGELC